MITDLTMKKFDKNVLFNVIFFLREGEWIRLLILSVRVSENSVYYPQMFFKISPFVMSVKILSKTTSTRNSFKKQNTA